MENVDKNRQAVSDEPMTRYEQLAEAFDAQWQRDCERQMEERYAHAAHRQAMQGNWR